MKLNDIKDKRRLLKNTPTNKIINIVAFAAAGGSFLLSGYFL
jgi:hypothetical protein